MGVEEEEEDAQAQCASRSDDADALDDDAQATAAVEHLKSTYERYFGPDRAERLKEEQAAAEAALRAWEQELMITRKPDAQFEFLRGEVLAVSGADYTDAERHISRALKLDPTHADAWLALGDLLWKQGKAPRARSCYEQALEICGRTAKSLRRLSVVMRKEGETHLEEADAPKRFSDSLALAKEAVQLDAKDSESWYILGNSYLVCYPTGGGRDAGLLQKALVAYKQAEKWEGGEWKHPDLHYNRAEVHKLLEDFGKAIADYDIAHELDPSLGADKAARELTLLCSNIHQQIHQQGKLKPAKLASLTTSILRPATPQNLTVSVMAMMNPGVASRVTGTMAGKIVYVVEGGPCMSCVMWICVDTEGVFFLLSISNCDATLMRQKCRPKQDTVWVHNPRFRGVCVPSKGREFSFPACSVPDPGDIYVNGTRLAVAAKMSSLEITAS